MLPNASLRHAILSLLSVSPMHGYKLRKMAGADSWIYPIKHTSVYTALHQLAKSGLVDYRSELFEGRARKIYSLTDAGREAHTAWLAEPPESDLMFSDLVAFKVAAQTSEHISASRDWMHATLTKLRVQIQEHQETLENQSTRSRYSKMAVEYGIDMLRLRAQLLERVIAASENEPIDDRVDKQASA